MIHLCERRERERDPCLCWLSPRMAVMARVHQVKARSLKLHLGLSQGCVSPRISLDFSTATFPSTLAGSCIRSGAVRSQPAFIKDAGITDGDLNCQPQWQSQKQVSNSGTWPWDGDIPGSILITRPNACPSASFSRYANVLLLGTGVHRHSSPSWALQTT